MSKNDELRAQVKETVFMPDVVERLDLGPIRHGKIYSIYHEEKEPSLHIYPTSYWDYSTGQGGDQIRFVMDVTGMSYSKTLRWLMRMTDTAMPAVKGRHQGKQVEDLTERFLNEPEGGRESIQAWKELVDKAGWPINWQVPLTLFHCKVAKHALWIPHKDAEDRIVGIKVRSLYTGKKSSVRGSTFTCRLYRPAHPVYPHQPSAAILVEGESDCWSMWNYILSDPEARPRYRVFALPSGANTWNSDFARELREYRLVWLMLDDDTAGNIARDRICKALDHVVPIRVPGGRVAEALKEGWNPM